MATVNYAQGYSAPLFDENRIYGNLEFNTNGFVAQRIGNNVYQNNLQQLGYQALGLDKYIQGNSFTPEGNQAISQIQNQYGRDYIARKGLEYFKQQTGYNGDFASISPEAFSTIDTLPGFSRQQNSVLTNYKVDRSPITGEIITQTISPINRYGADYNSNLNGNIFTTNYTPGQAQAAAIAQNQQAAIQANGGGTQMAPVTTGNIAGSNAVVDPKTGQVSYSGPVGGNTVAPTQPAQLLTQSGVLPTSSTQPRQVNQAAQNATNLNDFFIASGSTLPSITDRAGLYQRLTGKTGYQGTVAQNNELLGILKQQASIGGNVDTPSVTGAIGSDLLSKQNSTLNLSSGVVGNNLSTSSSGALTKLQPTQAEQNLDAIGKRLTELTAASGNQQADLLAQQNALGVPEKQKALDDVLAQAKAIEAQVAQTNDALGNQAIPTPFIVGQQNELQRTAAIKLNALAAYAETLRGNLESAKQSAKDYIDAKYAKQEAELKSLELQYQLNKDDLDREDKKASEQLQLSLELRKEALDLQKAADDRAFQKELLALKAKYDNAGSGGGTSSSNGTPTGTNGVPLSSAQKEDINNGKLLVSLIDQTNTLGNSINWSGVGGLYTGSIKQYAAKNFGYGTEQEQSLRNNIGQITGYLAKLRGGTSFTPSEQKLLETYSPTINDSPLVLQSKLSSLKTFLQEKNNLTTTGNYTSNQQTTVQPGNIRVIETATGRTGQIPLLEFNSSKYKAI